MPFESRKYSEPTKPVGRVAELFAGVGGFRIGLAAAGWKTVFSNQWEPSTKTQHASDVYTARFGEKGHSNEDVAKVLEVPEPYDLLVGGFPCQDYSVAKSLNASKGLEGKKGVLWWEILRLVRDKKNQPKFVFLENVDRLLKSPSTQRGRDFAIMLKTLGDEGYVIEWRVVSASDYGFPQRRIRVFIVAKKVDIKTFKLNPRETIFKNGILARALPVHEAAEIVSEIEISESADLITQHFNKGGKASPFQNSGVYFNGIAYTVKTAANYQGTKVTLGDVILDDADVPSEFWIDSERLREWEYLKGAKSITRTTKEGFEYQYAEGKMAYPDSLDKPARTILTGEGGSTPSRFKHIIKTKKGFRRLTPVELERLNGFPDNWTQADKTGSKLSDVRRAFFMGNALVIGLIELVGKVIAEDLKQPK